MTKALLDEPTGRWFDKAIRDHCDEHGPSGGAWNISMVLERLHRAAPQEPDAVEQTISAWAFAHNIDGAARNNLFDRLRSFHNPVPCAAPPMGPSPGYREVTIDRNTVPQEPVVDDDAEWLLPYRSMDEAGSPEAAACVGRKWIEDIAEAVRRKSGGPAMLQISSYGAGVTTLYQRNELLAVTTAFRDEMNFAVLVRWLCARLQAKVPETVNEDDIREARSLLAGGLRGLLPATAEALDPDSGITLSATEAAAVNTVAKLIGEASNETPYCGIVVMPGDEAPETGEE